MAHHILLHINGNIPAMDIVLTNGCKSLMRIGALIKRGTIYLISDVRLSFKIIPIHSKPFFVWFGRIWNYSEWCVYIDMEYDSIWNDLDSIHPDLPSGYLT